jgi:hypothetical protein
MSLVARYCSRCGGAGSHLICPQREADETRLDISEIFASKQLQISILTHDLEEAKATIAVLREALDRAEAKVARLYARGVDTTSALRDERDASGNLAALSLAVVADQDATIESLRARDAELVSENARMREALERFRLCPAAFADERHVKSECPRCQAAVVLAPRGEGA